MNSAKVTGPRRAMRRRMARSAWVGGRSVVVWSLAILLLLDQLSKCRADFGEGGAQNYELLPGLNRGGTWISY